METGLSGDSGPEVPTGSAPPRNIIVFGIGRGFIVTDIISFVDFFPFVTDTATMSDTR